MVVSLTLAAVTTTLSGSPPPSQTRWTLLPGLPRSTGFAPTWSPHAWPARSWCPGSPGPTPAGPARRGGSRPQDGGRRTPRRWPTRWAGASRSPGSHSQARGRAHRQDGQGAGHVDDRGQTGPVGDGAVAAAVGRARRGREQGLDDCSQLVRHEVLSKSRHGPGSCQTNPKGAKRRLRASTHSPGPVSWPIAPGARLARCSPTGPGTRRAEIALDQGVGHHDPAPAPSPRWGPGRLQGRNVVHNLGLVLVLGWGLDRLPP
jgi:hypothetical protein